MRCFCKEFEEANVWVVNFHVFCLLAGWFVGLLMFVGLLVGWLVCLFVCLFVCCFLFDLLLCFLNMESLSLYVLQSVNRGDMSYDCVLFFV